MRYCNPLPVPASTTDGAPQAVSLGDWPGATFGKNNLLMKPFAMRMKCA